MLWQIGYEYTKKDEAITLSVWPVVMHLESLHRQGKIQVAGILKRLAALRGQVGCQTVRKVHFTHYNVFYSDIDILLLLDL